jgi:hypothetical protein
LRVVENGRPWYNAPYGQRLDPVQMEETLVSAIMSRKRGCRYWRNLFPVALAGLLVGTLALVYVAFPILNARGVAHPQRAPVCCTTPVDLGLAYEDISFVTADGLTPYSWYTSLRTMVQS